jgi:integrase
MRFKLIPPGARKGNRTYYVRGTFGGRRREINTKERNEAAALRFAEALKRSLDAASADLERGQVTFRQAAELYLKAARRSRNEERYIRKLAAYFGNKLVDRIRHRHIAEAATALYPTASPETQNRQAFTPTASVLHYAADNDLCAWLRIRKLEESDPAPRAAGAHVLGQVIAAAEDPDARRLLKLLSYQGWRISEALGIEWERTDMVARAFQVRVGKARTWKTIPMHPEVYAELQLVPLAQRTGRMFPWRRRERFYPVLDGICKAAGVRFTPHMARHDFATDLNDQDVSTVDIVNAGTWTSTKSVERYIKSHQGRARAVLGRLPTREPAEAEMGEKPGAEKAKSA